MESANGRIVEDLDLDIDKPMKEKDALEFALADQKLTADAFKGNEKLPKGELVIASTSTEAVKENFRLCYAFNIAPETARESYRIFVDATTGAIVRRLPLFANCFGMHHKPHSHRVTPALAEAKPMPIAATKSALIAATFIPNYARYLNGQANLPFEVEQVGARYRLSLQGTTLNTRIQTGAWNYSTSPDVFNNTLDWGNAVPNATTAHWLTQKVYQFYSAKFGRSGLNDNGKYPGVYITQGLDDAGYYPNLDEIHFGIRRGTLRSLVTADVVGHEFTHGVIRYTANLNYEGESGAINESIADIMGRAFERDLLPNNNNWTIGEDAGAFRDLANPGNFGQPVTMTDPRWFPINPPCTGGPGGNDYCGVHTNSGVMNRWFHIIAEPTSVSTIGFEKAQSLVYQTLRYFLNSVSNFRLWTEMLKKSKWQS
jgi:hypothetical protein